MSTNIEWAAERRLLNGRPSENTGRPGRLRRREPKLNVSRFWLRKALTRSKPTASDVATRWIWMAAPETHRCFGPIVRLLIVTGQRREEVSGMGWNEIDRGEKLWTLPGDRTKNGEPNTVPLNALAISELDRFAGSEAWPKCGRIFATSTGAGFTAYAKGKSKLDRLIGEDGDALGPWRLHDLRRTLATGMQRLGVRFEVTEALLNHVSGSRAGVAGIYQRHDWKPEKAAALDAWNGHLMAIIDAPQEAIAA